MGEGAKENAREHVMRKSKKYDKVICQGKEKVPGRGEKDAFYIPSCRSRTKPRQFLGRRRQGWGEQEGKVGGNLHLEIQTIRMYERGRGESMD